MFTLIGWGNNKSNEKKVEELENEIQEKKREIERLENEKRVLYDQNENFRRELKESRILMEKQLKTIVEEKDKIIHEKNQLIVNERARNDSSLGSVSNQVTDVFDEAVNSLSDFLSTLASKFEFCTSDFVERKRACHQRLIESLFGEGIWKLLKRTMESKKMSKTEISRMISLEEIKGSERYCESLLRVLNSSVERLIREEIGLEIGLDVETLACINTLTRNTLHLAGTLILSEPRMTVFVPKSGANGESFNPDKHEDASFEQEIVITFVKRPGLICRVDNRVFARASVETVARKLE